MKIKEAQKIVGEMIQHVMYHQGISENRPPKMEYSLQEMVKANSIIEKRNKTLKGRITKKGRIMKISMVCDDRLIAALYALTHYDPSTERSIMQVGRKYLYVIHENHLKKEEDED